MDLEKEESKNQLFLKMLDYPKNPFLEYKKYDSVDRTLIRQGFMAAPVSKQ